MQRFNEILAIRAFAAFLLGIGLLVAPALVTAQDIEACDEPDLEFDGDMVTSVIEIVDSLTIGDVAVLVDVTYPFVGDLEISLTSPEATTVVLHDNDGGGTSSRGRKPDALR